MTPFLRFFLVALTYLLALTGSFGPALLFGLAALPVLAAAAASAWFLRGKVPAPWDLLVSAAPGVLVVTLIDVLVSWGLPGVRSAWGLYLNLLAFSPLVISFSWEKAPEADLVSELGSALKLGLLLTVLLALGGLVREVVGHGTLTLLPDLWAWPIPGLADWPLTLAATGAGGFFLAAAGVLVFRSLAKPLAPWAALADHAGAPGDEAPASAARPSASENSEAPSLDSTENWGETLESCLDSLPPAQGTEKKRLLVIGAGNGEAAYHLSMLCLDLAADNRGFGFRVRGVDHFAARIEAAIEGVYKEHQLEALGPGLRDRWMVKVPGDKPLWKVSAEPRLHVQFEVADFQKGALFFPQPAHLIVLHQGIEFVSDEKKGQLLASVCDHLLPGGALAVGPDFQREFLPEGMKRTGTSVFRKA